jgi:hypothetical protein
MTSLRSQCEALVRAASGAALEARKSNNYELAAAHQNYADFLHSAICAQRSSDLEDRWLRDEARQVVYAAPLAFMADDFGVAGAVLDLAELDAAIDAAMKDTTHE